MCLRTVHEHFSTQVSLRLCRNVGHMLTVYETSPAKFEPLVRISRPVAPSTKLIDCNLALNIICSERDNDEVTEGESVNPNRASARLLS